ncbi:MAG: HupE/UreJ family protein [Planctomycetota bacterium]|jgi:hypothetical protein|nr:HupE/UreJ family protein [Planctomycetota bacterium]
MLLPFLLALAPTLGHPNSMSSSLVRVEGERAYVTLRCQVLSFLEVIEGLDADEDGTVSAEEVEARRREIFAYAKSHYIVVTGSDREHYGGEALLAELESVALERAGPGDPLGYGAGAIELAMVFPARALISDLMLDVTLFWETSPDHIDLATIEWPGDVTDHFTLSRATPTGRSDPEGRGAFGVFLRLGWEHILDGWDHLCFVFALVLCSRKLRSLLAVVTAFTLAHSLSLALSVLGVVEFSAHARFIEAAIALSIAYVAVDNLAYPRLERPRWLEAFVFGLIHGLGFAGFLGESLLREHARAMALFSFNLGVELGQVAVVLAVVLVLRLLPRKAREEDPFLAPLWVRRAGSVVVALLGLIWFFQRI